LKSSTRDFQVRLGRGGFGSLFEGDLNDGTKVAVKKKGGFVNLGPIVIGILEIGQQTFIYSFNPYF